jgi:hypothetical protein
MCDDPLRESQARYEILHFENHTPFRGASEAAYSTQGLDLARSVDLAVHASGRVKAGRCRSTNPLLH